MVGLFKLAFAAVVALAATQAAPPTERVLDIPWHHQEHNLTCEAAALKMALSYYRVATGELTLLGYMTIDSRPAQFNIQGRLTTWGDPAAGFVGNPDGHIERHTGYGVADARQGQRDDLPGWKHVVLQGGRRLDGHVLQLPNCASDGRGRGPGTRGPEPMKASCRGRTSKQRRGWLARAAPVDGIGARSIRRRWRANRRPTSSGEAQTCAVRRSPSKPDLVRRRRG